KRSFSRYKSKSLLKHFELYLAILDQIFWDFECQVRACVVVLGNFSYDSISKAKVYITLCSNDRKADLPRFHIILVVVCELNIISFAGGPFGGGVWVGDCDCCRDKGEERAPKEDEGN